MDIITDQSTKTILIKASIWKRMAEKG